MSPSKPKQRAGGKITLEVTQRQAVLLLNLAEDYACSVETRWQAYHALLLLERLKKATEGLKSDPTLGRITEQRGSRSRREENACR